MPDQEYEEKTGAQVLDGISYLSAVWHNLFSTEELCAIQTMREALDRILAEREPPLYQITEDSATTCKRCEAPIVLTHRIGARSGKYVLASAPQRQWWKCDPTAQFPVRSHVPAVYANGEPCMEPVN